MAWIESPGDLEHNPKVQELMYEMKWDLDQTIGKLHRLWWWCAKYVENGELRDYNDTRIAEVMGVAKADAERLKEALVRACWLDREPYLRVSKWWDIAGQWLIARYKRSPEKWRKIRNCYVTEHVTVTYQYRPFSSLPSPPKPPFSFLPASQNPPTPLFGRLEAETAFDAVWKLYPSQKGRVKAFQYFLATVKTPGDLGRIHLALEKYKRSDRVKKGLIQDGSTWFEQWEDWEEHKEPIEVVLDAENKTIRARSEVNERRQIEAEEAEKILYENDLAALKLQPLKEQERIRNMAQKNISQNRFMPDSIKFEALEPEMVMIFRSGLNGSK